MTFVKVYNIYIGSIGRTTHKHQYDKSSMKSIEKFLVVGEAEEEKELSK